MSSNITYNIKLKTQSEDDLKLIIDTLTTHQKVWNHMSEYVFITKNINKKFIHDDNYYKCRKLFPNCPSQVIIRAKDSVYAAYKSVKSNKKLYSLKKPCEQRNLAMRLRAKVGFLCRKSEDHKLNILRIIQQI